MVVCNNCKWVGNESNLSAIFEVDGQGYTAGEINSLNLNDDIEDSCNGCPVCKTDSYLSDIPGEDLNVIAIDPEEVGTMKDLDQFFYQKEFRSGDIVATYNLDEYEMKVVCCGNQTVNICENKKGELVPVDSYEGEIVSLTNDPERFLKALELQNKSGKEYLVYGDSCWLDIEVYKGSDLLFRNYDVFGSVFGSISEAVQALTLEDIHNAVAAPL